MEEISIQDDNNEIYNILVLGEENSRKSSILNTISGKDNLFPENNEDTTKEMLINKKFINKKVKIRENDFDLYDTVGVNSSYQISDLKNKLIKFKTKILTQKFKLVLITYPVTKNSSSFSSLEKILNAFSFSNTKNVYIVFTKGEQFQKKLDREEEYTNIKDSIKFQIKGKEYNFDPHNFLQYDQDSIDEFRKTVLRKAIDLNTDSTNITINDKKEYDDDVLLNLFMNDNIDKDNEKEDNNSLIKRLFEWVKNYLNSNTFFNNPNMVL